MIDYNAQDIIDDNSFSELSHELLLEFVKRSSLRIDELSLFKAVDRWATKRCADETKAVNGASKRSQRIWWSIFDFKPCRLKSFKTW